MIEKPETWAGFWREKLGCRRPRVEIGAGKGDYLSKMAAMNPDEGWIGIEKERNVAAVAVKKYWLSRMSIWRSSLRTPIRSAPGLREGEIDVIHLNFSDPWPKSGYAKRRLSHARFLKQYAAPFSENGQVIMKTDNPKLFEFSLTEFSRRTGR